jgi:hypothetical protein
MAASFKELVIGGQFALVKGFLVGYRFGTGKEFKYFFHRKSGIRRDTLSELVKEVLELDNHVHVCIEQDAVDGFRAAVGKASPVLGLALKAERSIQGAHFDFSFKINNRQVADDVKKALGSLPAAVEIRDYKPVEKEDKTVRDGGTAGYAPLHEYTFGGQGVVAGDFDGVMEVFLRLKRLPDSGVVLVNDIGLEFAD